MKIAISGKGGVGKTLLASFLSRIFAEAGYSVIAIDADSNPTLASALGIPHPEKITPVSEMSALIEERTGAKKGQIGAYFKLNPRVDDIPEKYSARIDGIKLLVMGQVKRGGSGCYCPENVFIEALVSHLLLASNEVVIMDMEAGVEHLGRATAKSVDRLIVVVEPGRSSIEIASRIKQMASDIGITRLSVVGNKVRNQADKETIMSNLPGFEFLGFIPYDQALIEADLANKPLFNSSRQIADELKKIYQTITKTQ